MENQLIDRNKIIEQIKLQTIQFDIKPNEIFTERQNIETNLSNQKAGHHSSNLITKFLYYTGGVLLIAGVIFWISINWSDYSDFSKVLILLGTPIILYAMGYILEKSYKTFDEIAAILYILASILLPGGLFYSYFYATNYVTPEKPEYVILGIFSIYSIIIFVLSNRTKFFDLLTFFQLFSLNCIYLTLTYIASPDGGPYYASFVSIILGIIYLSSSFYFQNISKRIYVIITRILSMISLLSGVNISGAEANFISGSLLMSIFIAILFIYFSLQTKSSLTLFISTIAFISALIAFIIEVFGDFASWPILVILSGIIVISCGYYSLRLQQKYIKNRPPV